MKSKKQIHLGRIEGFKPSSFDKIISFCVFHSSQDSRPCASLLAVANQLVNTFHPPLASHDYTCFDPPTICGGERNSKTLYIFDDT